MNCVTFITFSVLNIERQEQNCSVGGEQALSHQHHIKTKRTSRAKPALALRYLSLRVTAGLKLHWNEMLLIIYAGRSMTNIFNPRNPIPP